MTASQKQIHDWKHQAEARSSGPVYDVLIDIAVPAMAAALQAVLALHHRAPFFGDSQSDNCPHPERYDGDRHEEMDGLEICRDAEEGATCGECYDPDSFTDDPPDWPCETVTAINEALEVEA